MRIPTGEACVDGQGGTEPSDEALIFEAWSKVTPRTGGDFFQAGQIQSRTSVEVIFRERRDVRSGDFIVYGDALEKRLRVQDSDVKDERGVWTVCSCEELKT